MPTTIPIFAYGSNLCVERIRERVPSATPVTSGNVSGRRLAFHKVGLDGSGKANALQTKRLQDCVWGAIYEIELGEKPILDECESLGIGYDLARVEVTLSGGGTAGAWIYEAIDSAITEGLKPFCWYRELVIHGAKQHRLPAQYIAELERMEFVVDEDETRNAQHRRLILSSR